MSEKYPSFVWVQLPILIWLKRRAHISLKGSTHDLRATESLPSCDFGKSSRFVRPHSNRDSSCQLLFGLRCALDTFASALFQPIACMVNTLTMVAISARSALVRVWHIRKVSFSSSVVHQYARVHVLRRDPT